MLVSIIVPIYNIQKEYLVRCVRSICEQTYKELEIILVDDGSTDGTSQVVDELGNTDSRIRVFHKDNGGSSSARNLGIDKSTGEYIGFIDSDDYVSADYVELMVEAIKDHGLMMAQISRDEIDENGERLPDVCTPPEHEQMITAREQIIELLMHRGDCSFCTRLTHRSFFENRRFPEGRLNEDFYLLMQMLLGLTPDGSQTDSRIDRYIILPSQSYHVFYRMNSNSRRSDREDFSRVFVDIVDNADWVEKMIVKDYPELMPYAKRFALYQRLDYLLHIPVSMMNRDNAFYMDVWRYIRKNRKDIRSNDYLTKKNRLYLSLMSYNPAIIRKVHRLKMKLTR